MTTQRWRNPPTAGGLCSRTCSSSDCAGAPRPSQRPRRTATAGRATWARCAAPLLTRCSLGFGATRLNARHPGRPPSQVSVADAQVLLLRVATTALAQDLQARLAVCKSPQLATAIASAPEDSKPQLISAQRNLLHNAHLWRLLNVRSSPACTIAMLVCDAMHPAQAEALVGDGTSRVVV